MATKAEELRLAASQAWDEFAAEMAKYNDDNLPNEEQNSHITQLRQNATRAQAELQAAERFQLDQREFQVQEAARKRSSSNPAPAIVREAMGEDDRRRPSIGYRFVNQSTFQDWLKAYAPNGRIPEKAALNSPPMQFGGLRELDIRGEPLTGGDVTQGGALILPDQYRPITEFGRRPLTIRQVITNLETDSDTVEYVRIVDETSNAAVVPEATVTDPETSGGVAGTKPESSMEFERVSTPVKTIAHWMPATTRVLMDAPQLRGLIDAFLRYYVDLELETQIVNGDGTGDNFEGILATDDVQVQPYITHVDDPAFFRTARVAKRKVLTIGRRRPNAYLLNPEDWEIIDLAADDMKRFYSDGPFGAMQPRLWGLPVIESEAVPVGTGLVGDFGVCVLWDRQQGSISVSNSHADFFIRNLVAILCELRAAFGILKPNAIVQFSTAAAS